MPPDVRSQVAPFDPIRALCLERAGTSETSSWGHPNFRVANRIYLTLEVHEGRPSVAFRVSTDEVRALCAEGDFFPTPYGKGAWASTYVDRSRPTA